MPELPEVESIRLGLQGWVTGARIQGVSVLDPRILGTTSMRAVGASAVEPFAEALRGAQIESVQRRGKFLWLPVRGAGSIPIASERAQVLTSDQAAVSIPERAQALSIHLGMSGQLRIHEPHEPLHRHTRAVLQLEQQLPGDGPTRHELRFIDQRIFGHLGVDVLVSSAGSQAPRAAAHIALDPLDPLFDAEAVVQRIRTRRTGLKAALLDQTVVSGIGNIYADESLFAAGVHPLAPTRTTRISRIRAVLSAADDVMRRALAQGGTSFDSLYVHVNGESGYFERSLQVYGRAGHPCTRCGTAVRRTTAAGRSSHYCPRCQRPPAGSRPPCT